MNPGGLSGNEAEDLIKSGIFRFGSLFGEDTWRWGKTFLEEISWECVFKYFQSEYAIFRCIHDHNFRV